MVHDEGRLNQMLLDILLEEEIQDVALLMALLIFHMALLRESLRLLVGCHLVKVDAGVLLHGLRHGEACKRLAEVDGVLTVGNHGAAANLLCEVAEHGLREFHHSVVIGVCLIELHQRKLGVVAGVHTLVTEHAADLEDSLKTADDQTL